MPTYLHLQTSSAKYRINFCANASHIPKTDFTDAAPVCQVSVALGFLERKSFFSPVLDLRKKISSKGNCKRACLRCSMISGKVYAKYQVRKYE